MSSVPAARFVIWRVVLLALFPTDTAPAVLFQVAVSFLAFSPTPKYLPSSPAPTSATEPEPKATEPSMFVWAPEPSARESSAFASASNPIAIARSFNAFA